MALDRDHLSVLEMAIAAHLPPGIALATDEPTASPEGLFDAEAAAMDRAVPKRRAEFAAGRRAAHRAMGRLGLRPAPVPMGPDRAPQWPAGLVGSIAHCEGACVALVARARDHGAVAIDLEPDADLPADLVAEILLPGERAALAALPEAARLRRARAVFSAKECAFKLQYPITGKMMGFEGFKIDLDVEKERFCATFAAPFGPISTGHRLSGRSGVSGGIMFSVMYGSQGIKNK